MGSTSDKVNSAIARLKRNFSFLEREEGNEGANLALEDGRELGKILEACEIGRVFGRSERFSKPVTTSALKAGSFRMANSVWLQRLVEEVPSVGKHEVHYVNASGYWLVLMEVGQKPLLWGMMRKGDKVYGVLVFIWYCPKRVLTMRKDYYHSVVISGAPFAAKMARSVEAPMLEVENSEY